MNDIKKLIQMLKEYQKSYIGHDYIFYDIKFCNPQVQMCIEALEKQIPKKPKQYIDFFKTTYYFCPVCEYVRITGNQKHCDVCGQKIDWRVEE